MSISRTSTGVASGHVGEFMQGAIHHDGSLRRILVSIPAPALCSTATFASSNTDDLTVFPLWKQKSLRAFHLAWRLFSETVASGQLTLSSNIPVSRGMGSSTADCVAAIRAAAAFFDRSLEPAAIATIAHQAECYSDATMYEDHLVVFQHCVGLIQEELRGDIPDLQLVIVESCSDEMPVETDKLARPNYTDREIREFSDCLGRLRQALVSGDRKAIAEVSQISAQIDHEYNPKQQHDALVQLAKECGALGVASAHSGDIRVLLYKPGELTNTLLRRLDTELQTLGLQCWKMLSTRQELAAAQASCL